MMLSRLSLSPTLAASARAASLAHHPSSCAATAAAAQPLRRLLSTSPSSPDPNQANKHKHQDHQQTQKQVRDLRSQSGGHFQTLAYRSLGLMLVTGAALYVYFDIEKEKAARQRAQREADQAVGKPKLGGPFTLLNQDGETVTDATYRGKFMLVYFGFTNCPDVCPEELEKMAAALDSLPPADQSKVQPIFISVDPKRDDVAAVREYVREFHPRLHGLTGTYPMVKATAKAYRVYFSSPPPEEDVDEDYIVDHSIFMYLMDPRGEFVDAYGKNLSAEQMVEKTRRHIEKWEAANGKIRV
ncbi:thioredoxin-like protein [Catenaria anguillulae PL171]|uniref:Thioredoxin-like protein n=1 Tax=Catenaria anguillulae PL171 TaxID=765915 RepID=A0A1Y2HU31_9FUNG|nr:thioredoxin-like protein [Catenaria anguillulae PL171]